ncbi:PhoH-like ATPase [Melaminivora alkalimesophila]|uniref:PhoH-like ATPase n=3 Tax=Melaminivora alkalimesophila TaxID=1165852 RepID=A0A317RBA9_9BURK|nr:PhoH family protein [Melaminivora alkalimesophila]PWW45932.1 PhoH-like ATPase [Melaminivora alkalimesophila]
MPLPPAPTKRAAVLAPAAYRQRVRGEDPQDAPADAAAATPAKASRKTNQAAAALAARRAQPAPAVPAPAASAPAAPTAAAPAPGKKAPAPAPAPASAASRKGAAGQAAAAPLPAPAPTRKRKAKAQGPSKMFVLDTNVLLHDPTSLFRFEEHDIFLPMVVLEELDNHKKGMTEVARNGRQASRTLDALVGAQDGDIADGLRLDATGHGAAGGCLYFQTAPLAYELPLGLPQGKSDNQILGVVAALRRQHAPREVVLVSKDINMRVKARALGLPAEDYQSDKTLDDADLLYTGSLALAPDFWTKAGKNVESWQRGAQMYYRISGPVVDQLMINQFVFYEAPGEPGMYARVTEIRERTAVLETLKDYGSPRNAVWGVNTRNREQNFAMNLLMDPEVDFVTLTGQAGTGKTLLALAAGLTQVLDERRYTEIIMTRATVSVGEDIGFLPGTEEEKMGPWMGALDDNLEFLAKGDGGNAGEWGRAATNELIRSRIKIKSMNFMRGRTFLNKYVIIDEAQNLTPKQMKTLVTRAGPGTKIICMGNLAQIDTPYLTEGSSGLTYAVDRFKGWPHSGHILLARGERSRLADFASEVL